VFRYLGRFSGKGGRVTTQGLTAAEWARAKMDRPMSDLISDLAEELEFRKDTSVGIPTGFDGWDDRLGGLYPGELVSVVGLTNDFAAPLVVVDGYEEFVLSAADGPATGDHVVAIRAAAQEMGFALVIAGRLRGESTDWDAAIDEVPEDLAHYPRCRAGPRQKRTNVDRLECDIAQADRCQASNCQPEGEPSAWNGEAATGGTSIRPLMSPSADHYARSGQPIKHGVFHPRRFRLLHLCLMPW